MSPLTYRPDRLSGFESTNLQLPQEDDGPLRATLVRMTATPRHLPAVLFIHGFVDYFFHAHLARAFREAGLALYALDLRRYGRSLHPENRANQAGSIDEYFPEIDWALEVISSSQARLAGVVAHSTGALVALNYEARGRQRSKLNRLVLNSPFFSFRLTRSERLQFEAVKRLGARMPKVRLPVSLPEAYGKTLHVDWQGEWNYDLQLKPLKGFPFYAGWFYMIDQAQAQVRDRAANRKTEAPVLTLRSARSRVPERDPCPEDFAADTVLDVSDMERIGGQLGRVNVVEDGLHDLTLSLPDARQTAIRLMVEDLTLGC